MFINSEPYKLGSYSRELFLNNIWILLEFLKKILKVYVQQVFVNVRWNFIFSRHHVW